MRDANARAAAFIRDRGNISEHIRLEEHGLGGNGHMLMSEINSAAIADLLVGWIEQNLRGQASLPGSDAVHG